MRIHFWFGLNHSFFIQSSFFTNTLYFLITFFTLIQPASAQSLDCSLSIPDSWKNHFPFDLIYPIGDMKPAATECPQLVFFGTPREVCSVLTITKVAKACFLLKIVIQSLINL